MYANGENKGTIARQRLPIAPASRSVHSRVRGRRHPHAPTDRQVKRA